MTTLPTSGPKATPRVVTAEVAASGIRLDDGTRFPIWIRFVYDTSDPYALGLLMCEQADFLQDATFWTVARETVYVGCELRTSAGLGDFFSSYIDEQTVQLTLHAPQPGDTSVLLNVPRPRLSAFLQRTEVLVPLGRESAAIDMDALVADLMGR